MRPGIIAAMVAEARILAKGPVAAGRLIHLAEGALLLVSGIGPGRARLAARTLLGEGATALVSWGCAGGLAPGLPPGSLVLPESVLGADQSVYQVDPVWHERLCSRLKGRMGVRRGILAESRAVLSSERLKKDLFRGTGAVAADMESGSIGQVAKEAEVSFVVIRAITDPAEMGIPQSALDSIDLFGQVRPLKVIRNLARHPREILSLIRLRRNFGAVQTTLTAVSLHAGSNFLYPDEEAGSPGPDFQKGRL
jgi:adenosylhomocysteine nucleosidase